jgi:hypothetical protein
VRRDGERLRPHRIRNSQCECQSCPTLFPADDDFALTPDRVHEALKLESKCVCLGCLQHNALYHIGQLAAGAGLPTIAHPHEFTASAGEIEGEIPVGLEESQAANSLPCHS